MAFVLDIGGEGRHAEAWNLNPRERQTVGPHRGDPIPRHLAGRGEQIPLGDDSVDVVIVERTPLWPATLAEIRRVVRPGGTVILRHVAADWLDPHRQAIEQLAGASERRPIELAGQAAVETVVVLTGGRDAYPTGSTADLVHRPLGADEVG